MKQVIAMPKRDKTGRFVASTTSKQVVVKRDSKGRFLSSDGVDSSFIQSIVVNNDLVEVRMKRNPKIVYVYRVNSKVRNRLDSTMQNGGSLGRFFNKYLKGHEVYRTIYR